MQRVLALLLAAGRSQRFGVNKLYVKSGRHTMLEHTLARILGSGFDQVVGITGRDHELTAALFAQSQIATVHNPNFHAGMMGSLQLGLQKAKGFDFVTVLLADQPQVQTHEYEHLLTRIRQTRKQILVPTYKGQRGTPVTFSTKHIPEILAQPAQDRGAAFLLKKYPEQIEAIEMPTDAVLRDIDTPQAFEEFIKTQRL